MLTPKLLRIIAVVVGLAGCLVVALGAWTLLRERALAARGVETTAVVTAVQHRRSDSDTGHQVQYRFEIDGRAYQHVGVFGTSVPADIGADALSEAVVGGRVAVRYLPDDPSVNAVASASSSGRKGPIALAIGAALLVAAFVRWRLAQRAAERGAIR